MTSAWGRLGAMERISVGLPKLDTNPSATSTASLNNMASTSSHFQGTGYGMSSSSVRIIFILGTLFCVSTVHSLSNHLILGLPLFRTFPSSFFLRSALLFSPYARTSSASYPGLPLLFLPLSVPRPLILSFLIMSTFVISHIHHSNFFYCAFCNVPAPILPLSCTAFHRIFTFIFCHPTLDRFLPILLTVMHTEGDFCIQFSIFL